MKTVTRFSNGILSSALLAALVGCAQSSSNPSFVPASSNAPATQAASRASMTRSTTMRAATSNAVSTNPTFTIYTAGKTRNLPFTAAPRDVAVDPNGVAWFTDMTTPAIGRIWNGQIQEFRKGLRRQAFPYSIVAGPGGMMWFSDGYGAIGSVSFDGTITEYPTPYPDKADPSGITVDPYGDVWTISSGQPGTKSYLIRLSPQGAMTTYDVPAQYYPDGSIQADNAGNLWMFASKPNGSVVLLQYSTAAGLVAHQTDLVDEALPCCPNVAPKHIAIGPDRNPWFTTLYFGLAGRGGQVVGTYASGAPSYFDVLHPGYMAYASGITSTSDTIWFVGSDPLGATGALWKMTTSGVQTVYSVPTDPAGLAAVDDNTLWFTGEIPGEPPQIVEAKFTP